jgi:predicted PurR-regulated permease PerM
MSATPPAVPPTDSWHTIPLVIALALLVALGYAVIPVLSPFVLLGGILYILYPLRDKPVPRRMMVFATLLFLLWFTYSIIGILAPFIVSFLIAYLINPFVSALERKSLPRWASSLLAVVLFLGFTVLAILFVIPPAISEFESILYSTRVLAQDFVTLIESGAVLEFLSAYGIPVERAREMINEQLLPRLEGILTALFEGLLTLVTSISSLAMHVINIIIVPFLVFYLLMDFPDIVTRAYSLVPASRKEAVANAAKLADDVLGKYFRGAIIVAVIQGTISATALWLIGVRYPLVLGIMTGLLNFIPYVGLITSLVVSSIVALFSGGLVGTKVAAVIVLYLSQKLLEATVLGPKIVGSKVGLHPVLLILCLLVFGHFLGLVGMLIAVPVTALINVSIREWEARRKGDQETAATHT